MGGFTKLHSSLTASSIWNEPDTVRIVWVTMLSMADGDGNVKASVLGLAHLARKTLSDTESALAVLLAPDPHSGRKEMEGRRITPVDGGWHLVTHAFYREAGMSEDTKRYWREKKREQKSKAFSEIPRKSEKRGYASGSASPSASEKGKGIAKGKPSQQEVEEFCQSIGLPASDGMAMFLHWEEKGWAKLKDWRLTIRKWKSFGYLPSQKKSNNRRQPAAKEKVDYSDLDESLR